MTDSELNADGENTLLYRLNIKDKFQYSILFSAFDDVHLYTNKPLTGLRALTVRYACIYSIESDTVIELS